MNNEQNNTSEKITDENRQNFLKKLTMICHQVLVDEFQNEGIHVSISLIEDLGTDFKFVHASTLPMEGQIALLKEVLNRLKSTRRH